MLCLFFDVFESVFVFWPPRTTFFVIKSRFLPFLKSRRNEKGVINHDRPAEILRMDLSERMSNFKNIKKAGIFLFRNFRNWNVFWKTLKKKGKTETWNMKSKYGNLFTSLRATSESSRVYSSISWLWFALIRIVRVAYTNFTEHWHHTCAGNVTDSTRWEPTRTVLTLEFQECKIHLLHVIVN